MVVVTMEHVQAGWGTVYDLAVNDGTCTARALFGNRDLPKASSSGELLTMIHGHYPSDGSTLADPPRA